jgi:hypothetical protein
MILKHYGFDTNTSIQFFKNEEAKKKFFDVKDYIGSNQVKNQFRNAQPIGNY